MGKILDVHCHLDEYDNPHEIVSKIQGNNLWTISVTALPMQWEDACKRYSPYKFIRVALGLHPLLANEYSEQVLIFRQLIPKARYIGEIGLDGSKYGAMTLEKQKEVLKKILQCIANQEGKILSIHSRGAEEIILSMLESNLPKNKDVIILHWYTGNKKNLLKAIDMGCYFSVNTKMIQTQRGRELIREMPSGRVLTESDGPFIKDGKTSATPLSVLQIIPSIADIWGISTENATKIVWKNFSELLKRIPLEK